MQNHSNIPWFLQQFSFQNHLPVYSSHIKKDTFLQNEKYFRPSRFPAFNVLNLDNVFFQFEKDAPLDQSLPDRMTKDAFSVILYFFSFLREANQGAVMHVGCGSIGNSTAPYPLAYTFLSSDLKNQLSYEQFLKLFEPVYHLNLIAAVPLYVPDSPETICTFLVEAEALEGNCFSYYFGQIEVKKEHSQYRINGFDFSQEDFFCAAYHGWQHNAELAVAFMYHDWCSFVKNSILPCRTERSKPYSSTVQMETPICLPISH